jgi:small-conductance mechanosensitive channel
MDHSPVLDSPLLRLLNLDLLPGLAEGAALFLGLMLARAVALRFLSRFIESRRITSGWGAWLLHLVQGTQWWFLFAVGAESAIQEMHLKDLGHPAQRVLTALIFLQLAWWATVAIREIARDYTARHRADGARVALTGSLVRMGYLAVWVMVALSALDNFGVHVTALLAGLGIGGVAVAFALQNILQDIFASFSIVLDKPFVIGDFITVNDKQMGTVEHIGLKTTRLRALSGEQVVMANRELLNNAVHNFGRMYERRVVFTIGVEYGTPAEKLKKIPLIIRQAIETRQDTRFGRSHFANYGAYALDFETVFFVLKPDYNLMMDIRQDVYHDIYAAFAREGIAFALPLQVEIHRPAPAAAPARKSPKAT